MTLQTSMEVFLTKPVVHQHPLLRGVLAPVAVLFSGAAQARKFLYRVGIISTKRLPGYVISVGNITLGGTGKSPFVIALAEYLKAKGHRPAILTRGYHSGMQKDDCAVFFGLEELITPRSITKVRADEARMQAAILKDVPVVVGQARYEAALHFLSETRYKPTHWLLDDGFQHLRLHRDLDIVLVDAALPFGNGQTLPLGNLREPPSALKRADAVVLTRASEQEISLQTDAALKSLGVRTVLITKMNYGPLPAEIGMQAACALCAIAKPQDFYNALRRLGVNVQRKLTKPDHGHFNAQELESAARDCPVLITTEKDYWRDPEVFSRLKKPVYVLPMRVDISREDLENLFSRLITQKKVGV